MLYSLVISVCMISTPTDCRSYEQPVTELSSNPSTAFIQAQRETSLGARQMGQDNDLVIEPSFNEQLESSEHVPV